MRVKKQKRHRKIVRFYTACFGFRQPYKVLCDGTFVHHLIENRITPADIALSNTLAAPVKLFATKSACVLLLLHLYRLLLFIYIIWSFISLLLLSWIGVLLTS